MRVNTELNTIKQEKSKISGFKSFSFKLQKNLKPFRDKSETGQRQWVGLKIPEFVVRVIIPAHTERMLLNDFR